MSNRLKKPRRANLQLLFCRLIRSQVARAEREWSLEPNCRQHLFPLHALPGGIFFAPLLSQKRCETHHCPTSQNCHSRPLGISEWFLQSCCRQDTAMDWGEIHGNWLCCCAASAPRALRPAVTTRSLLWHRVYIPAWLSRNLGSAQRLTAFPGLDIYAMLFLVSAHLFSLLCLQHWTAEESLIGRIIPPIRSAGHQPSAVTPCLKFSSLTFTRRL